jgi:hypothetical protein
MKERIVKLPDEKDRQGFSLLVNAVNFGIKLDKRDYEYFYGPIHWVDCREELSDLLKRKHTGKFFCAYYNKQEANNVMRFIKEAEKRLKLPIANQCKLYRTTQDNILLVQLSKWWKQPLRESLFTILVRVGRFYGKKAAFFKTLWLEDYLDYTKEAVCRFFAGYTQLGAKRYHDDAVNYGNGPYDVMKINSYTGWADYFQGVSKDEVNKVLIKRKS